jgi:hypothetical protein
MLFFQAMKDVVGMHQYRLFCDVDLLMNQEIGNWVKA